MTGTFRSVSLFSFKSEPGMPFITLSPSSTINQKRMLAVNLQYGSGAQAVSLPRSFLEEVIAFSIGLPKKFNISLSCGIYHVVLALFVCLPTLISY